MFLSLHSKLNNMNKTLKELFDKVTNQLDKLEIDWNPGTDTGWSDNSIVLDSNDEKILVYVCEDEKGKLWLNYYDLFEEGEYSIIFDSINEETTTSERGGCNSVKKMLKDLDLIEN